MGSENHNEAFANLVKAIFGQEVEAGVDNLRETVMRWMAYLPEREYQTLVLRFGLEADRLTLSECAKRFGLSRERIRQLENRALLRMRDLSKFEGI